MDSAFIDLESQTDLGETPWFSSSSWKIVARAKTAHSEMVPPIHPGADKWPARRVAKARDIDWSGWRCSTAEMEGRD
jgi:hypothetical protein